MSWKETVGILPFIRFAGFDYQPGGQETDAVVLEENSKRGFVIICLSPNPVACSPFTWSLGPPL